MMITDKWLVYLALAFVFFTWLGAMVVCDDYYSDKVRAVWRKVTTNILITIIVLFGAFSVVLIVGG